MSRSALLRAAGFAALFAAALTGSGVRAADAKPAYIMTTWDTEMAATFWDAASVKREGDVISFDVLRVIADFESDGRGMTKAPLGMLYGHQVDCAWRTERDLPYRAQYHRSDKPDPIDAEDAPDGGRFIAPGSSEFGFLDALCAGVAPDRRGAVAGVKAAFAASRKAAPGVAERANPARPTAEVAAPWISPKRAFVDIPLADPAHRRLFLDTASVQRQGQVVTAVTLAVLATEDHQNTADSWAVLQLRRVRYDCAARSLNVEARAGISAKGKFLGEESGGPSAKPIAPAEIAAVCEGAGLAKDAAVYPGVREARDAALKES